MWIWRRNHKGYLVGQCTLVYLRQTPFWLIGHLKAMSLSNQAQQKAVCRQKSGVDSTFFSSRPLQWAQVREMGLQLEPEWTPHHNELKWERWDWSQSQSGPLHIFLPLCLFSIGLKYKLLWGWNLELEMESIPHQHNELRWDRWDWSWSGPPTTKMSSGEIEMGLQLELELNPLTMSSGETEMGLELEPEWTPPHFLPLYIFSIGLNNKL